MATEKVAAANATETTRKIVLLTGNHLCHNPRAFKEARSLAEAGYEVEVIGAWFDAELKLRDHELASDKAFLFTPVTDFTTPGAARLTGRAKSKAAKLLYRTLRVESDWQLSPLVDQLSKAASQSSADLFIAHSEPGMAVACDLLDQGRKVGVDMEDWFSEDLPPEARKVRPLKRLRAMEAKLLSQGAHTTCTSRAMAEALSNEYRCKPPHVVYNAFPWSDRKRIDGLTKDRRNPKLPSIHWYSQTLGFGRGLEDLIAALPFVRHRTEIHLRGRPAAGFRSWLPSDLPDEWRDQVFVHDLVSPGELLSRIAEHDIGFAGEQKYCRSRELTVTNKILHYLLAGVTVVASDTAGQREIAEHSRGAVMLYRAGDPKSLADQLNSLLESENNLSVTKRKALEVADQEFCWERQEPKILQSVQLAFSNIGL